MWTLMSDYRKAYHFAHDLVVDMKSALGMKELRMTPKETLKFISVTLYLQQKLKMWNFMMDLHESFVCNSAIMTKCNPFCLYYII